MKYLTMLCLALGFGIGTILAQPPGVDWSRVYGGTGYESMWSVVPAPGGTYLVSGETGSAGDPNGDFWVLLLDATGDTIWTRTYGTPDWDVCTSAIATTDGGFALVGMRGYQVSQFDSTVDGWFIKLDASGDSIWSRLISNPGSADWPYAIEQTSDGGYIVAGGVYPGAAGDFDGWIVKLDGGGATQWQQTYGGAADDRFLSIALAGDGGYVMDGYTFSFGAGSSDGWLLKTDAAGSQAWSQTFGTAADEAFTSLSPTADGGFLLIGYAHVAGPDWDWRLVKTDNTGTSVWQQQYGFPGGYDLAWDGLQTDDGGYVIGGHFQYPDAGGIDLVGLKLDVNGDSTWSFRYGGDGVDYGGFAVTAPDGGYIFAGDTYSSWSHGSADWLLVKTQTECADPTPQAPIVTLTTGNSNAYLHWNPVTQSVSGCPITPTHYLVFYTPTLADPFYYHGYTTGTDYTHWGVVAYAPGQYYDVIASTAPLPMLRQLPSGGVLTQDEVMAKLNHRQKAAPPVAVETPGPSTPQPSSSIMNRMRRATGLRIR